MKKIWKSKLLISRRREKYFRLSPSFRDTRQNKKASSIRLNRWRIQQTNKNDNDKTSKNNGKIFGTKEGKARFAEWMKKKSCPLYRRGSTGANLYRPDNARGKACESSGRQRCAGVCEPRVSGAANAKWRAPLRRSPPCQILNCARCWSTIRTSGSILAWLCPELQQKWNEWETAFWQNALC